MCISVLTMVRCAHAHHLAPLLSVLTNKESYSTASRAGIMDQSAILASETGKLTVTTCLQPSVRTVAPPWPIGPGPHAARRGLLSSQKNCPSALRLRVSELQLIFAGEDLPFRILLAFSGIKAALASASGFNDHVSECRAAAAALLEELDRTELEPILGNISQDEYRSLRDTALSGEWLSNRRVRPYTSCSTLLLPVCWRFGVGTMC